jgi:hypothetical protein
MKRKIVDFEQMTAIPSLYNAWRLCSAGPKAKRRDVKAFNEHLDQNLLSLQSRLRDGSWTPDPGHTFIVHTDKKDREIHTVKLEDRIVHYLLVKFFDLDSLFIRRTFGSIKGRGTLKANKQVRKDLQQSGYRYCIQLDVKKYYVSIIKDKLVDLVRRKYKGAKAIQLFSAVIHSYKPDSPASISIGAPPSQNNGNFYLTPLDHFVLQELGVRYYTRYVDDMVILVRDKEDGARIIDSMSRFAAQYGLTFGKIALYPIDKRRIDFCAYAVNQDNVRVRSNIKKRFIHKLRQLKKHPQDADKERSSVCSYLGFLKYCNSSNLLNNIHHDYSEVFDRIDRCAKGQRSKKYEATRPGSANERVSQIL